MAESIQNCTTTLAGTAARSAFIARAAELYDRPVDVGAGELAGLDDAGALLLAFPWMSDPELLEALWALAQYEAAGCF